MDTTSPGELRQHVDELLHNLTTLNSEILSKVKNPLAFIHGKASATYKMMCAQARLAQSNAATAWDNHNLEEWLDNQRLINQVATESEKYSKDLTLVSLQLERLENLSLEDNDIDAHEQAFEQWKDLDEKAQSIHERCAVMYEALFEAFPDLPIEEPTFNTRCGVADMEIVASSSSSRASIQRFADQVSASQGPDPLGSRFSDSEEETEPELDLTAQRRLVDQQIHRANEALAVNEQAINRLAPKTEGVFGLGFFTSDDADSTKLSDLRSEQQELRSHLLSLQAQRNNIMSQIQTQ